MIEVTKFPVPLRYRRGRLRRDELASIKSGLALLDVVETHKSLNGARILDYGCGVKIVQALHERGHPQSLYVGVDVYEAMIDFLKSNCNDERYFFASVNFHNQMYNRDGLVMTPDAGLPIPTAPYDIITMFSVITHLNPNDTHAVLEILRKYSKDDTILIFSAFIKEGQTEDFIDAIPEKPLFNAFYKRSFLESLIFTSGW